MNLTSFSFIDRNVIAIIGRPGFRWVTRCHYATECDKANIDTNIQAFWKQQLHLNVICIDFWTFTY